VQFGAVDAEAGHGVEHETAEKARAIRLEEALQGPPDAVVVDEGDLVGLEPEERRIMTGRPIVHRVQRLMRERQVAHHHADGLGRRQAHPAVCARQVFLEQLRHREAIQEVVHHRQGAEHLCVQSERTGPACRHGLHCIQCQI